MYGTEFMKNILVYDHNNCVYFVKMPYEVLYLTFNLVTLNSKFKSGHGI